MSERKRLLLRLDPDVYERIARWAADDLRSVNAQIEYALRRALRAAGRAGASEEASQHSGEPTERVADHGSTAPAATSAESVPDDQGDDETPVGGG